MEWNLELFESTLKSNIWLTCIHWLCVVLSIGWCEIENYASLVYCITVTNYVKPMY